MADVLQLQGPVLKSNSMGAPFQDGHAIDLTTDDWVAESDTTGAVIRGRLPRGLYSNLDGSIKIVPACAPSDHAGIVIYVFAGKPIEWAVRKIIRAGCDVGFHNATSLVAGY